MRTLEDLFQTGASDIQTFLLESLDLRSFIGNVPYQDLFGGE